MGNTQESDAEALNGGEVHDDWSRELGAALAEFQDGAAVFKVSLPSDFSAVRLNNLPQGSSVTSVTAFMSNMDVAISADTSPRR
ncbi:hypothetical protein NKR23_g12394 [Pleurostoma richardsiae]|uniref:Uncharacterized protein n=1 Tax=Pleurostoma richardsiae TaxID=41990 RepID=A0AA38RG86_9PEZI|nr:hypothetical protein NKR23_g12394 [Pleurostoma richardsiae]